MGIDVNDYENYLNDDNDEEIEKNDKRIYHDVNIKSKYMSELANYSILTSEEQAELIDIVKNHKPKDIMITKKSNEFRIYKLNIPVVFKSLVNTKSYNDIIKDLINFYEVVSENALANELELLKRYQQLSSRLQRALNSKELLDFFNIADDYKELSEKELLKQIKEFINFKDAINKLVTSNLKMVVEVANKYKRFTKTIDYLDLINEGNMGLFKAIEKYDSSKGTKYSSYATDWIYQSISLALENKNNTIRIARHKQITNREVAKKIEKLLQSEQKAMTNTEIAEALNLPVEIIEDTLKAKDLISLNRSLSFSEEDGETLCDTIVSDSQTDSLAVQSMLESDLQDFLKKVLNEREVRIVNMRFGTGGYEREHTMREIAKIEKISYQRVSAIIDNVIEKLNKYANGNELIRAYLKD